MKFQRLSRVLSAGALSGAIVLSAPSAIAGESHSGPTDNHQESGQLDDHFDFYEDAIAVAGGEENLSDHEIQEIMIRSL